MHAGIVSRDYVCIRQAALELFEEALAEEERDRAVRRLVEREQAGQEVANRESALESLEARRSLADGYYAWVDYLLSLQGTLSAGFQIPLADLRATEVLGLRAVAAARRDFEASHPSCPACAALNRRGAVRCRKCDQQILAKGGKP